MSDGSLKSKTKLASCAQLFVSAPSSSSERHSLELRPVPGVSGVVLRVLHPHRRLHREQGLHQRQHAAVCGSLRHVRLTQNSGNRLTFNKHKNHLVILCRLLGRSAD